MSEQDWKLVPIRVHVNQFTQPLYWDCACDSYDWGNGFEHIHLKTGEPCENCRMSEHYEYSPDAHTNEVGRLLKETYSPYQCPHCGNDLMWDVGKHIVVCPNWQCRDKNVMHNRTFFHSGYWKDGVFIPGVVIGMQKAFLLSAISDPRIMLVYLQEDAK